MHHSWRIQCRYYVPVAHGVLTHGPRIGQAGNLQLRGRQPWRVRMVRLPTSSCVRKTVSVPQPSTAVPVRRRLIDVWLRRVAQVRDLALWHVCSRGRLLVGLLRTARHASVVWASVRARMSVGAYGLTP